MKRGWRTLGMAVGWCEAASQAVLGGPGEHDATVAAADGWDELLMPPHWKARWDFTCGSWKPQLADAWGVFAAGGRGTGDAGEHV